VYSYEKPDIVLFDIDPEPPADIEDAIHVALLLKEKLDLLDLKSYVKTTGKKGLHVVVPVVPNYTFKQTRAFVHEIGKLLAKESALVVSEFSQSRDPETVYVDYTQNTHFKTMICPYSLRANEHAAVSTPLEWGEIEKGVRPQDFNIFSVLKRDQNPWEDLLRHKQTLDFESVSEKGEEHTRQQDRDSLNAETHGSLRTALKEYVQKRDLARTGEPSGGATEDVGSIFVVQEHHARRLHYDFRLAKEGVLKSWAVPKGFPEKPGMRRLAVQTEDHPLEYSEFEGTIPKGHYGAGTVKTWDRGVYQQKTWTDDKIEFFLKGKRLTGMYALIKLKKLKPTLKPQEQKQWLLIKLKDQNARA
jgi:DNA ligase D-like protein (predicted 3'-phosphoesterase)